MTGNAGLAVLAQRLRHVAENLPTERRIALEEIGEHGADTARNLLGTYQPETGPFPAWPELADSTKAERVRLGFTENDPLRRSGELAESISYRVDGTRSVAVGSPMDEMVYSELGTVTEPPRPALGPALIRSGGYIVERLSAAVTRAFRGA
ncbi:MAG: hypothetical protein WDN69_05045 [Aliidongia sp.]